MKCKECGHDLNKIKLLEIQVSELRKYLEIAESEFKTTNNFLEIIRKMDKSTQINEEVYEEVEREALTKKLELLRLHVAMIRKISPASADILTERINEFEKAHLDLKTLVKDFGEIKGSEMTVLAFLAFVGIMASVSQRVEDMVKACSLAIHDTINRVK